MPLFSKKFSPKKSSPRKIPSISRLHREFDPAQNQTEFGLEYGPITVKLGNQESIFKDGKWQSTSYAESPKTVIQLKIQNEELQKENNLLKLKVEILLDMLAETTAEVHLQETEIEQLKSKLNMKSAI
ncbi:protein chibby homolog 1-like [Centruroides sculpturatus]|uniref:protein chibby homolog 1-like n=1 Tax=Centruroides sculpturatus TaxID=218467 RepID=UPI000C6D796A|nr:protein chibby homolog 1-like [Centruroides sculpturatus]XP_023230581.1 protein chibby homolog 1-like [Centruroides sculpturatus]